MDYYLVKYPEDGTEINLGIFPADSKFHAIELAFQKHSSKYSVRELYKAEKA